MGLFRLEVIWTQSTVRRLVIALLKHHNLRIKLLSEVPEDFFFAQGVAVNEKFVVWISPSMRENHIAELPIGHLLTWK